MKPTVLLLAILIIDVSPKTKQKLSFVSKLTFTEWQVKPLDSVMEYIMFATMLILTKKNRPQNRKLMAQGHLKLTLPKVDALNNLTSHQTLSPPLTLPLPFPHPAIKKVCRCSIINFLFVLPTFSSVLHHGFVCQGCGRDSAGIHILMFFTG